MNSINQIELQNIRHICGHCGNFCDKITYYKTLTQDQRVIDAFDAICNEATKLKQDLSNLV